MKYEYRFLTIEGLIKEYPHLNKYYYKGSSIWANMIRKMAEGGWRFIQFIPPLNMRRPGPYGSFIFERPMSDNKKTSSILNDSGK